MKKRIAKEEKKIKEFEEKKNQIRKAAELENEAIENVLISFENCKTFYLNLLC